MTKKDYKLTLTAFANAQAIQDVVREKGHISAVAYQVKNIQNIPIAALAVNLPKAFVGGATISLGQVIAIIPEKELEKGALYSKLNDLQVGDIKADGAGGFVWTWRQPPNRLPSKRPSDKGQSRGLRFCRFKLFFKPSIDLAGKWICRPF
ncbi:MAG TPA: hypothetical protein DIW64_18855 [Cellvibrio sp.]|nr:hypothetical protein [Cellvibrio sp.]